MNCYPNTWRGVPEAQGPMQPHRLHQLKAGPAYGRPGARGVPEGTRLVTPGIDEPPVWHFRCVLDCQLIFVLCIVVSAAR